MTKDKRQKTKDKRPASLQDFDRALNCRRHQIPSESKFKLSISLKTLLLRLIAEGIKFRQDQILNFESLILHF